jgi:hypothetical protein
MPARVVAGLAAAPAKQPASGRCMSEVRLGGGRSCGRLKDNLSIVGRDGKRRNLPDSPKKLSHFRCRHTVSLLQSASGTHRGAVRRPLRVREL